MPNRLAALTAVRNGTVTARRLNVTGSPLVFEPRSMQVDLKFLLKAGIIEVDGSEVTERVLTRV
jgi:hypothetical protein